MLAKFGAQGSLRNSLGECVMGGGCGLGGDSAGGSAQPQTLGLQKSNVCWQLHCNMYLEALEISATVRPPLPVRLEFIGNHEWVVLGPLGWLVGGWGPGLG